MLHLLLAGTQMHSREECGGSEEKPCRFPALCKVQVTGQTLSCLLGISSPETGENIKLRFFLLCPQQKQLWNQLSVRVTEAWSSNSDSVQALGTFAFFLLKRFNYTTWFLILHGKYHFPFWGGRGSDPWISLLCRCLYWIWSTIIVRKFIKSKLFSLFFGSSC